MGVDLLQRRNINKGKALGQLGEANAKRVPSVVEASSPAPRSFEKSWIDRLAHCLLFVDLATKKVSPKGIGSGIRMIQYFINRGGKGLSAARRRELESAKRILQDRVRRQRTRSS
jgi:hypothetical protein